MLKILNTAHSVAPSIVLTEEEIQRFWRFVQRGEGCWEWIGRRRSKKGSGRDYGAFRVKRDGKWKTLPTHQLSYFLHHGREATHFVCHKCDNPPCVNPDHLWDGTPKENVSDMIRKGRRRDQRGTKNPISKLSEETISKIRSAHDGTASYRKLGEKFGIQAMTAWRIVNRKSWSHIP